VALSKKNAEKAGVSDKASFVNADIFESEKAGVSDKASFVNADIFESDFSRATVITMYLLPHLNLKLRPIILDLKPGTRIVSHAFTMGEWAADQTVEKEYRTAYLWIVPAKVEGVWKWQDESGKAELSLTQEFQNLKGTLKVDGKERPLKALKLEGDRISFGGGDCEYAGRANGHAIDGTVKLNGREQKWSASLQQLVKR